MSSKKRQVFLKRWVERQARDIRKWPDYKTARQEIAEQLRAAGRDPTTVLYRSAVEAARQVGVDVARGEAIWGRKVAKAARDSMLSATQRVGNALPAGKIELITAMAQEKARLAAVKAAEDAKREIEKEAKREQRAKLRAAKARADKEEARAKAEATRQQLYREKRKRLEQQRKEEALVAAEQEKARQVRVVVPEVGPFDIVRDVKWVYQNAGTLVLVSDDGKVKRLNPEVIAQAPSNGAIAMATYFLSSPESFLEKFVSKLIPRSAATDAAKDETEERRKLDPNLSELEQYFGNKDAAGAPTA